MGLTDKIKSMPANMQQGAKNATQSLSHILLRLISGFFVGFVLALIIQELFHMGSFMLVFLTVLFLSLIFTLLSRLSMLQIIIFDVICVLVGALLRMYILIAPN
jgi:F0F1-type ATP synthase assembly protein I